MDSFLQEHVVSFFVEDGGAFAVAGEDGGVVGKAEQALADALAELLVVAASEVGAAYAAAEERVAGEDPALDFGIEADAAIGMAGRTNHFQSAFPYLDDFVVFQPFVGQLASAVESQSEEARLPFGAKEIVFHALVRRHGNVVLFLDGRVANDMVDVAVGADDHQRFEAVAVDEAEELVFLACRGAARVDDDAFLGVVVVNDKGVFREGIEDDLFELEHDYGS